ncbi:MAG: HEAT repeat domain-containing protein [Acidiferrobacterales bacterium]
MSAIFQDESGLDALRARLSDPDPAVRRIAIIDLLDSGADEAHTTPLLIERLRDSDAEVRREAALTLEGRESVPVLRALLAALSDAEPMVREGAAQSLSEVKDPSLGPHLLEMAMHPTASVRAAVLRALRPLRLPGSLQPALDALASSDPGVRREAVGVLGYLKDSGALAALAAIAESDPETEVRRSAVGAIGYAASTEVAAALIKALRDPAWRVRQESAATLGKLQLSVALAPLMDAMADPYWQVRVQSVRSLGRLRDARAVPVVTSALRHEISNLRKEAAIALGEIGDVSAIPALEEAMGDSDPDVRKLAGLALQTIFSRASV